MDNQVEEIKGKVNISELIGEYVELKKAGKNFKGLCPFHSEKTPSFVVSDEMQRYKCFGCSESGDVYTFLEKYEGMDFYEALKFLADKTGVVLKHTNIGEKSRKDRLYKINSLVSKFYSFVLTRHSEGKMALSYLQNRGIGIPEINTFKIGYSPNVDFAMRKFIVDKNKTEFKDLMELGIVYRTERGFVDRFRGRVIFPLHDHRGNPIGFAGRILPELEGKNLAKYINSPETPLYHKSSVLYGLNITKDDIKKENKAVVVEGELDMISSRKAGIKNTVAIKGTALTAEQVKLISRYADEVILALDADSAGGAASRKGITIAEKEGLSVKVATLPKYKDPDEAARDDPEYLKKRINEPIGVWDFLINLVFKGRNANDGTGKAKLSREIVPILASIDDRIVQAHYIKVVADKLGVSPEAVSSQVDQSATPPDTNTGKNNEEISVPAKKDRKTKLEERLFSLMLLENWENLLKKNALTFYSTALVKRLSREVIAYGKKYKTFEKERFLKFIPAELVDGFIDLSFVTDEGYDNPKDIELEIAVIKRELREIKYKERLKKLSEDIATSEREGGERNMKSLQNKFKKLPINFRSLKKLNLKV
jgi:DNA primase